MTEFMCNCTCADKCPLGRSGMALRCTFSDLATEIMRLKLENAGLRSSITIPKLPPGAGYWLFGGTSRFYVKRRPRWLTRVLMRLLLEWMWQPEQQEGGK